MNIFVFTLAAVLSLPKQFITVYLGGRYIILHLGHRIDFGTVVLEHTNDSEEEKQKAKKSRLISNIVLVITLIITVAAMWWIWRQMLKVRPTILRERRIAKKWVLSNYLGFSPNFTSDMPWPSHLWAMPLPLTDLPLSWTQFSVIPLSRKMREAGATVVVMDIRGLVKIPRVPLTTDVPVKNGNPVTLALNLTVTSLNPGATLKSQAS